MAYLLTRDWGRAEDLVQTALAKAWAAWRRIDGDPDPYVYRVIVNTHAGGWRRRWRGEVPTAEPPERDDGTDFTGGADDRAVLWAAIGRLSHRQRAVVVLRYYEGLTFQQVADVLGCSTGTAKTQSNRALSRLRVDIDVRSMALGGEMVLNGEGVK
jgi:RNA polymerase sigma-70 factor (sigma-E family)